MKINRSVKSDNESNAAKNRRILGDIKTVNIMGSPGCGKTTVIEQTARHISGVAVIQGDLESDIDKKRLEQLGIPTYQINTHSGCHLNAKMVYDALQDMDLTYVKVLLIENVGNLVCPTGVNLGQDKNIIVSSTTEGHDKPQKYPIIFKTADAVVVSKMDLAKYVDFDLDSYVRELEKITDAKIFTVTSKEPESFIDIAGLIKKI